METKELALKIKELLDDKKGEDIVCFYIREKSTIAVSSSSILRAFISFRLLKIV